MNLVPLSSFFFPGWPTAPEPSHLFQFMVMFGAPLLIGLLGMGLGVGMGNRRQYSRDQEAAGLVDDPKDPRGLGGSHAARRALPSETTSQPVVVVEDAHTNSVPTTTTHTTH